MKKTILCLGSFILMMQTFSQTTSQADSKEYYLKKSKSQKTVAWILLGGGTVMAVGGAISYSHDYGNVYVSNSAADVSALIMFTGIASDIISIPFFVSAAKNKKRAAAISFINQPLLVPHQNAISYKMQPTLYLKIQL